LIIASMIERSLTCRGFDPTILSLSKDENPISPRSNIQCAVPDRGPSALSLSKGAVLDAVGPTLLPITLSLSKGRLDVRRLRLGAPAAVDQLPPGHGAGFVIGLQHRAPEERLALGLGDQPLDDRPLDVVRHTQLLQHRRLLGIVDARQHDVALRQARADDPREI
jgi:hypothetical protein